MGFGHSQEYPAVVFSILVPSQYHHPCQAIDYVLHLETPSDSTLLGLFGTVFIDANSVGSPGLKYPPKKLANTLYLTAMAVLLAHIFLSTLPEELVCYFILTLQCL